MPEAEATSNYEFDLGQHHFKIFTTSSAAQQWFDRGLTWLYGFNHEEAVICFQKAVAADPNSVMAYWGIAYAIGPNYNKVWEMFPFEEKKSCLKVAHDAIAKGSAITSAATVEVAMLAAVACRYPQDAEVEDYAPFNDRFANEMRKIHQQHPDNLDVSAIFIEALMGRTPWALWHLKTKQPAEGASTIEAKEILEAAFASNADAWKHPGLLHLYIHLMEMSPTPEVALPHGDHLTNLVPASGHLLHMATHIDVLCGDYQNVISRNQRAALADQPFTALRGARNFYTIYRIHNVHFIAYGAMFLAQKQVALDAALELQRLLPESLVAFMPDFFEAFWGMKLHVMVRFGMWAEILTEALPKDSELFSFTTALQRYARVIALANTGQHEAAALEYELFLGAKAAVQETRFMFNNPAADVLGIAQQMAAGERLYKSGKIEAGLTHLRAAAEYSDNLFYDEPWGWMQPPRHALAALLMDQDQLAEAEEIYRADLGLNDTLARPCQHPSNIWSLHGLSECLSKRGERHERVHVQLLLDQALARAEVPVRSSCYCRNT
ncbi:MAG: tetratricopeptide (TPR) repeat protein [Candidatus Azotimanducaceae bacterium]|jgi:tetratricopeptide (TPR) repeat protein